MSSHVGKLDCMATREHGMGHSSMTQLCRLRLVLLVIFSLSPIVFGQQPNTSSNAAQVTQPPQMDEQTAPIAAMPWIFIPKANT